MLFYFTRLLFKRKIIIMAFHSRNFILLIHGVQNYARPFDEIPCSYDSNTTQDDNLCLGSTPTKDVLT
jgi:hypothetical protein